jgi:hypothetical protein
VSASSLITSATPMHVNCYADVLHSVFLFDTQNLSRLWRPPSNCWNLTGSCSGTSAVWWNSNGAYGHHLSSWKWKLLGVTWHYAFDSFSADNHLKNIFPMVVISTRQPSAFWWRRQRLMTTTCHTAGIVNCCRAEKLGCCSNNYWSTTIIIYWRRFVLIRDLHDTINKSIRQAYDTNGYITAHIMSESIKWNYWNSLPERH